MKWYLDFDDTLYRTTYGYSEMCRAVAQLYDIRLLSFVMRMLRMRKKFASGGSSRGALQYFHTIRSYGIDPAEAEALIFKRINNKDYLYKDAVQFLDWLEGQGIKPTILTFGDPETQDFKMSLIPRIRSFEKIIVQEPKQDYLKKLAKHDAILVDDKPVVQLPQWCRGVLLARKPSTTTYPGKTITSLTELIDE